MCTHMKLFTKLASLSVGLAMAVGVGVAVSQKADEVKAGDNWVAVTSTTSLSAGDKILIVSNTGSNYLGITTSSGHFQGIAFSQSVSNDANGVVTLESTGTANRYKLASKGSNGYITASKAASGGGQYTNSDDSGWDFSYDGGWDIIYNSNSAYLRVYNETFRTYSKKSNQACLIYKYSGGGSVTSYTITYNANGGTGEMEDTVGEDPAVQSSSFTAPSGKIFGSWNDSSDGKGDSYAVGDKPKKDLNLYAIWIDQPVCVTLTNLGASLGSTANDEIQTVDINDSLTSETYTLNYFQCKKQTNTGKYAMFMTKSVDAFISNNTEMPGAIESVEVFILTGAAGGATYDVAFGKTEFTAATAGIGAVNITGGNSHVFENTSIAGAKYFCVTLGSATNGQVLGLTINYQSDDPGKKNMVIKQSGSPAEGASFDWNSGAGHYVFEAYEDSSKVSGITWSTSDSAIATINSSSGALTTVKPGSVTVIAEAEGYNNASASITINSGSVSSVVVSGSMSKTAYNVGELWSHAGLTATVNYSTGYSYDGSDDAAWTYNPASPALNVESVVATATIGGKSGNSSAQAVTVTKTNPLQAIYSMAADTNVDVYGYFVGNKDGNNIIIMDGAYGMDVYKSGIGTNSYVAGETILHVTGKVSIFNGLYEIANSTVSEVSSADISTPEVYAAQGGETAEYASRTTTVTGIPTCTKNDFSGDAGAKDITMSFAVGGKTVQVFYHRNSQTTDDYSYNDMKNAVANGDEITVQGFTSWYNGFQVNMNSVVKSADTYTAEAFAQDLLDQTDEVCKDYDGQTNNRDALVAIWSDLAGADKYPSLPGPQKTILADANRDEGGSVVEQAMARYDYLTGKYNLANFINGRTPVSFATTIEPTTSDSSSYLVIIIVIIASIALDTIVIAHKKRKFKK